MELSAHSLELSLAGTQLSISKWKDAAMRRKSKSILTVAAIIGAVAASAGVANATPTPIASSSVQASGTVNSSIGFQTLPTNIQFPTAGPGGVACFTEPTKVAANVPFILTVTDQSPLKSGQIAGSMMGSYSGPLGQQQYFLPMNSLWMEPAGVGNNWVDANNVGGTTPIPGSTQCSALTSSQLLGNGDNTLPSTYNTIGVGNTTTPDASGVSDMGSVWAFAPPAGAPATTYNTTIIWTLSSAS